MEDAREVEYPINHKIRNAFEVYTRVDGTENYWISNYGRCVNNLSCTCEPCNFFKGNILPDTFFERISLIYLYQMEKKFKGKLGWKIAHKIIRKMT